MTQYNRERVFQSGGKTSIRMLDVLPHNLTLDTEYTVPSTQADARTLFREVEIVPALDSLDSRGRDLLELSHSTIRQDRDSLLNSLLDELRQVVRNSWSKDKFHLIFHSSGIDSRLMGGLIREAYEELGDDWFGNTLFVCFGYETPSFLEIMGYWGWDQKQYVALSDFEAYHKSCLEFETAWTRINGPMLVPCTINAGVVHLLQRQGLAPADEHIQVWSGYGANEFLASANAPNGNQIASAFLTNYSSHISLSPYKGAETVYPYMIYDVLSVAAASSCRLGSDIRQALLTQLDPRLASFPRLRAGVPNIPQELLATAKSDYLGSWYGKNVKPDAVTYAIANIQDYSTWWSRWTAAVFTEHLLQECYEITCA